MTFKPKLPRFLCKKKPPLGSSVLQKMSLQTLWTEGKSETHLVAGYEKKKISDFTDSSFESTPGNQTMHRLYASRFHPELFTLAPQLVQLLGMLRRRTDGRSIASDTSTAAFGASSDQPSALWVHRRVRATQERSH